MAMVKMTPDVLSCSDDKGNMEIQINLPGVKKENVELKMVEEGFFIRAKREETGSRIRRNLRILLWSCPSKGGREIL